MWFKTGNRKPARIQACITDPDRVRTCNLRLRKPTRYPIVPRGLDPDNLPGQPAVSTFSVPVPRLREGAACTSRIRCPALCVWPVATTIGGMIQHEPTTPPHLTADVAGIGGVIKQRPEDFIVEEIPLYEPCGEGTHVYVRIEKHRMTTPQATQRLARALGKNPRDVGFAGLKDAQAITRQTLSIEHVDPDVVGKLDLGGMRILDVTRHGNKLKTGHLAGNRFEIRIRDVEPEQLDTARNVLETLQRRGAPNYFGPQRFGIRGDNAGIGRCILLGDYDGAVAIILGRPNHHDEGAIRRARELFDEGNLEESVEAWPGACREQIRLGAALIRSHGNARRAWRAVDRSLRRLYLSAFQSELFNRVVAQRMDTIDQIQLGDLAYKHANGACFPVEDVLAEQPRCTAFEISATGPIFGKRMTATTGQPGEIEDELLHGADLPIDVFRTIDGIKLDGARRPIRVPIREIDVDAGRDDHGQFLRLMFALPPGSYATTVTREICKTD